MARKLASLHLIDYEKAIIHHGYKKENNETTLLYKLIDSVRSIIAGSDDSFDERIDNVM